MHNGFVSTVFSTDGFWHLKEVSPIDFPTFPLQLHAQDLRLHVPGAARLWLGLLDEHGAIWPDDAHEALVGADVAAEGEGIYAAVLRPLPKALIFPLWDTEESQAIGYILHTGTICSKILFAG